MRHSSRAAALIWEIDSIKVFKITSYSLIACILIGVIMAFFWSQVGLAKMNSWQLLPRLEPYTELYFTDQHQPSSLVGAGTKQNLPFTIHNYEHRSTEYHYEVIAALPDGSMAHQLAEGAITLAHDQSWALEPTITIPSLGKRVMVQVILNYQGVPLKSTRPSLQVQSIHYWANTINSLDGRTKRDSR